LRSKIGAQKPLPSKKWLTSVYGLFRTDKNWTRSSGRLRRKRQLPDALQDSLELIRRAPTDGRPGEPGCSLLGLSSLKTRFPQQDPCRRLLASFPSRSCIGSIFGPVVRESIEGMPSARWPFPGSPARKKTRRGRCGVPATFSDDLAEHGIQCLDLCCRVCAATLSDFLFCVPQPLGHPARFIATAALMRLRWNCSTIRTREQARAVLCEMLARKKKMGFFCAIVYYLSQSHPFDHR